MGSGLAGCLYYRLQPARYCRPQDKPISVVILGESTDDEDDEEECVYECLYDSLPVSQEKELKQQDSSLVKIAEVAERSIKKLRRNWSIKKDDLSKGLSKIKRSSKTLIEDVYTKEGIKNESFTR